MTYNTFTNKSAADSALRTSGQRGVVIKLNANRYELRLWS